MEELKALAASWGRSFLAACLATYTIVGFEWRAILASGVAAVLPAVIRYLNPNDPKFGINAK
jgi:hypothetical protein